MDNKITSFLKIIGKKNTVLPQEVNKPTVQLKRKYEGPIEDMGKVPDVVLSQEELKKKTEQLYLNAEEGRKRGLELLAKRKANKD